MKNEIKDFNISNSTFDELNENGVIKGSDLIILVHGFTQANETEILLEYHSRMTPFATVLMLDWRYNLDTSYSIWKLLSYMSNYYKAAHFATAYNLNGFLSNFENFTISCIGHSLGSHMCGSICRNLRNINNKSCDRIVGLDVASMGFWKNGELKDLKLTRNDANYVVFLMTTKFYGIREESLAHEYITANIDGFHIDECPPRGKYITKLCAINVNYETVCVNFSIGNGESSSCAHTMPVLIFAKSMDIKSGLNLVSLDRNNKNYVVSGWNGYVMSTDRRFNNVFPNWLSTNETGYVPRHMVLVKTSYNVKKVSSIFGKFERVGNRSNEWVIFIKDSDYLTKFMIYIDEGIVEYLRVSKTRIMADNTLKLLNQYRETKNCYSKIKGIFTCDVPFQDNKYIIPRITYVTDNRICKDFYPFSMLQSVVNYTKFVHIGHDTSVKLLNDEPLEYVFVDGKMAWHDNTYCDSSCIKVENNKVKICFNTYGVHNVDLVYLFRKIRINFIVGKNVFFFGTQNIVKPYGTSIILRANTIICKNAKWYFNGVSIKNNGCSLIADKVGYYRYVIDFTSFHSVIGDFVVNSSF